MIQTNVREVDPLISDFVLVQQFNLQSSNFFKFNLRVYLLLFSSISCLLNAETDGSKERKPPNIFKAMLLENVPSIFPLQYFFIGTRLQHFSISLLLLRRLKRPSFGFPSPLCSSSFELQAPPFFRPSPFSVHSRRSRSLLSPNC